LLQWRPQKKFFSQSANGMCSYPRACLGWDREIAGILE
jgi:hypothetical protein